MHFVFCVCVCGVCSFIKKIKNEFGISFRRFSVVVGGGVCVRDAASRPTSFSHNEKQKFPSFTFSSRFGNLAPRERS